jgi:carboxypeptidase C (cathepsin A)
MAINLFSRAGTGALVLALLWILAPLPLAQDAPHPAPPAAQRRGPPPRVEEGANSQPAPVPHRAAPLPADTLTSHEITLAGQKLGYIATAGSLPLTNAEGETTAEIFYVSFTLAGVADTDRRPITYLVNGGPGAASAYLDIGAVGPRALEFGPAGTLPPRHEQVGDNPDTWLPFTDLVFIDPVGTGYSHATGGTDAAARQFWNVKEDLTTLADIIRLHLTRTGRIASPIYLVGESYGGFRAARLAYDLAAEHGIAPAGVILISPVIEFSLMSGSRWDPLPWVLRLPSYVAAVNPGSLVEAEQFALHDYLTALAAGPQAGEEAERVYAKLASLTGIEADSIKRWRGRIPLDAYLKDARHDGRVISRYDATVSGADPDPWSRDAPDDPVLDASIAPFTGAFVAYARQELGFKTDLPFALLSREVGRRWDWGGGRRSLSASDALRRALALEPRLKVMIAHGRTDLQTPYMMSRYVRDHMPGELRDRIALNLYDGGHMLYLHSDARRRLHDDAAAFYAAQPAE